MKNLKWILVIAALVLLGGGVLWRMNYRLPSSENAAHTGTNPLDSRAAPPLLVLTPAQSAPAIAPDTNAAGQRTFADMPARDRRAIVEEIRKLDLATIFQRFLDAGRIEHDPMKQSAIQGIMTQAMKEQTLSPEFLERMRKFVADSSNSKLERGSVISAFGSAGTKDGAEFVIWAAMAQPNKELRDGALHNISNLGGGGSREYLPPRIEPLWRESNDTQLLKAVAIAMAQEGAPSCIKLLLPAAAAPDGQDDMRRDAAVWALTKVYTKNAVPPLAAALDTNPLGSRTHTLAFTTLSQIGDESAARAVMSWLQAADGRAAQLATQWITQAHADSQLQAAEAALNTAVSFRDEKNREAIRAGLAAYRAGHKLQ